MSEMMLSTAPAQKRKQRIELSAEEYAQLNMIIDLLIPSDDNFPPPSSLHLIDEFLHYLRNNSVHKTSLFFNEQRLRKFLRDINISAEGDFCRQRPEVQQALLRELEQRDPAFFQALWMLANHSYYARLATLQRPAERP